MDVSGEFEKGQLRSEQSTRAHSVSAPRGEGGGCALSCLRRTERTGTQQEELEEHRPRPALRIPKGSESVL